MCGVFGIISQYENVIKDMSTGMHALQHRGKESAGIAFINKENNEMCIFKEMGFVNDLFLENNLLKYHTNTAIGHIRYSTTGQSSIENAHPLYGHSKFGELALVHNGNITNFSSLVKSCNKIHPIIFQTQTDTEIILHLIAQSTKKTLDEAVVDATRQLRGAFSFLLLSKDALYAARDPHEFRGLVMGYKIASNTYVFASETVALDIIKVQYIRSVAAGEIIKINRKNFQRETLLLEGTDIPKAHCAFEKVYLENPASLCEETIDGEEASVCTMREMFGKALEERFLKQWEKGILPNAVISIPDSGNPSAIGFADASEIPLEMPIIRNHYSSRTFMSPHQKEREDGVKTKFMFVRDQLIGKRIVVVDDSLVRGITLRWIISELRQCDVAEVHVCIASPPIIHPCAYGVDMKSYDELIAVGKTEKEISDFLGADSLMYLPLKLFKQTLGEKVWCLACFDGICPI